MLTPVADMLTWFFNLYWDMSIWDSNEHVQSTKFSPPDEKYDLGNTRCIQNKTAANEVLNLKAVNHGASSLHPRQILASSIISIHQ